MSDAPRPPAAHPAGHDCASCALSRHSHLVRRGVTLDRWNFVVALAGNPNTGKSTVFNALTGLRQHTGNWPGKTVARAEGGFEYGGSRFKLIDLPGTYSLLSNSPDEQIARDFILFGQPDVTVIVADATRLERNLNLALQVIEITPRAVVCLNLIDEARRHGITVDDRQLARDLGVPVVPAAAARGEGLPQLLAVVSDVATGHLVSSPRRLEAEPSEVRPALAELVGQLRAAFPALPNPRWVAMRLLGGDDSIIAALRSGELGHVGSLGAIDAPSEP
ncbi:MAG: FeoB small GTPase domain-containing protein [Acidobacteriota bacterium]